MSAPDQLALEQFLESASERLQFLREYSSLVPEAAPRREEVEQLFEAAHWLGTEAQRQGFPLFGEIAGRMAHVFQYALHAELPPEAHGPLVEFLADAITVLEGDLMQIFAERTETFEDVETFKRRYSFAFPQPAAHERVSRPAAAHSPAPEAAYAESAPQPAADAAEALPEDEDVPAEVLEFFVPEADEHLQSVTESLLAIESGGSAEFVHKLFRAMHTVKGSAAQVGLRRVSAVAHRMEDLVGRIRDGSLRATPEVVDLCLEAVDLLKKTIHRQWPDEAASKAGLNAIVERLALYAPGDAEPAGAAADAPLADSAETHAPAAELPTEAAAGALAPRRRAAAAVPAGKSVRIALDRLDRMMNAVGELVINRTRMVGHMAELEKLVEVLNFSKSRLVGKIDDFQEKHEFQLLKRSNPAFGGFLRGHGRGNGHGGANGNEAKSGGASVRPSASGGLDEFSDLEMDRYDDFNILSRSLTEISADVNEVLTQLDGFLGRVEGDIGEFTKLAHNLQDEITQARMVPIGHLSTRLSRTVREAAKETGRMVDFALEGEATELDNNIIQQLADPLVHLVRNAVAHGIEDPDERRTAGKSERGRVTLRAYHRGNHIFLEVEDDGRGIDYGRVRDHAIEASLISPEVAHKLSERELREILFHPGFSTASSQTELAGRGVGLDVVRSNVAALDGEIEVRSEKGSGCFFSLKVPLTLIISQALFVRCSTSTFAFPLSTVEEIRRIKPEEIEEVGGKLYTRVRDLITEIVRLDSQLELPPLEAANGFYKMVLVRVANRQVGIVVEEVLGKDEIVIKSLGTYLRRVKLFPGATIAPDGSLILLIDLNRLVDTGASERRALGPAAAGIARVFAPGAAAVAAGAIPGEATDAIRDDKVVLVTDDSISVRKFVGRMLEKAGYRVKLASDGLEAAEVAAQSGCHLILTDIEMPRMNGYELMAHLRQDPATRRIPVMVLTSRAGAKHKERAMKEGAAAFLTKPVQEEQLLTAVADLIGETSAESRASRLVTVR
ncbi:MAG TPA: hybrid sensor histidine kinase/response regulator [Candidatus Acidoferrales bacterium]|nr:hybrid sensor histidine kinase/response regulator [Candidatus Acidoferrales bacterium]